MNVCAERDGQHGFGGIILVSFGVFQTDYYGEGKIRPPYRAYTAMVKIRRVLVWIF